MMSLRSLRFPQSSHAKWYLNAASQTRKLDATYSVRWRPVPPQCVGQVFNSSPSLIAATGPVLHNYRCIHLASAIKIICMNGKANIKGSNNNSLSPSHVPILAESSSIPRCLIPILNAMLKSPSIPSPVSCRKVVPPENIRRRAQISALKVNACGEHALQMSIGRAKPGPVY
ncbi:uncharacterized protein MYCFIDRAFT_206069 [Pseudocercospora fijiensis CIRAD86]|uniref:Uncharacterized protein n=1 Tax=Pseudocercospora fijiensis (strain CIRAD86) TaxID=383855 RepID=N1QBN3_PSEFD|nr:uncharacterized protein MYCFIDRAFT_206069 [Pseudocercospora fijiensis CIRAD86]EME88627.1 hypothetical protein MYCFIDRAFT_206069 [Pseudocercospora fijiensis CIRAD86]